MNANLSQIMKNAWSIARKGAEKFGGKAREYFRLSLVQAWKAAKAKEIVVTWKSLSGTRTASFAGIERWTGSATVRDYFLIECEGKRPFKIFEVIEGDFWSRDMITINGRKFGYETCGIMPGAKAARAPVISAIEAMIRAYVG